MQVIDNVEILEMIGGSRSKNITCKVSTSGAGCEGSLSSFYAAFGEAVGQLNEWGSDLGCWLYDVTH